MAITIEEIQRFKEINGKNFLLIEGPVITDITLLTCETVMISQARVQITEIAIAERMNQAEFETRKMSNWLFMELNFALGILGRWRDVMHYRDETCHVVSTKNVWRIGNAIEAACRFDRLIGAIEYP